MAKVTKSQIIEGLTKIMNMGVVTASAEVQAELDYTLDNYKENPRNVTMDDLKSTIGAVEREAKKPFLQLVAEAEGKPVANIEDKKVVEHIEKKKLTPKVEKENKIKPIIAPKDKKEEPKGEEIKEVKEDTKKTDKKVTSKVKASTNDLVIEFPPTIESDSLKATLVARPDLKTIEDIAKAYTEEVDFVIASYWTRRQLKQYASSYDPMNINPNRPKSFENDLDLIEVTFANNLVVTGCSLYSYIPQIFLPKDFEIDEDSNLRFANGVEFEVYEVVANE